LNEASLRERLAADLGGGGLRVGGVDGANDTPEVRGADASEFLDFSAGFAGARDAHSSDGIQGVGHRWGGCNKDGRGSTSRARRRAGLLTAGKDELCLDRIGWIGRRRTCEVAVVCAAGSLIGILGLNQIFVVVELEIEFTSWFKGRWVGGSKLEVADISDLVARSRLPSIDIRIGHGFEDLVGENRQNSVGGTRVWTVDRAKLGSAKDDSKENMINILDL